MNKNIVVIDGYAVISDEIGNLKVKKHSKDLYEILKIENNIDLLREKYQEINQIYNKNNNKISRNKKIINNIKYPIPVIAIILILSLDIIPATASILTLLVATKGIKKVLKNKQEDLKIANYEIFVNRKKILENIEEEKNKKERIEHKKVKDEEEILVGEIGRTKYQQEEIFKRLIKETNNKVRTRKM